jgi:hypothetical protein
MTIVCPRATMARIEILSRMLRKLVTVKNDGVSIPTTAISSRMKMMMLSSRNLTRVRKRLRESRSPAGVAAAVASTSVLLSLVRGASRG